MRGQQRARRVTVEWVSAIAATLLGCLIANAAGAAATFTVPPALRPQVDFWIAIFATYSRYQDVIHDTEHLDRVYSVLDFRELAAQGASGGQIDGLMRAQEDAEKQRVRAMLYRLQDDPDPATLSAEELRLQALFASDPSPTKYLDAAASDRIRGQRGLRERFAEGIAIGHAYFPYMEEIFRRNGVPVEITRLPLVESTFNMKAYSKVGAAGVWQFMPGTARHFMRVDDVVDERLDPLVATAAAATFMRQNYDRLGTWPLAIKAYNHGPGGMARAVRDTGTTDIATIIRDYKGPAFKFASRNFYPEFLAALHVEHNHRKYFGEIELHPPLRTETVELSSPMSITSAARCADADVFAVSDLNPSLLPPVRAGRAAIPSGYSLRLPAGGAARFRSCAVALPASDMARRATERRNVATRGRTASTARVHRVQRGQTLAAIAARYGCTIDQIRRGNSLKSGAVRTGQLLRIPPC
ncbi:transglycosylase SLT domain-containing protein [bacterium]|nr:transglycosylase SLT domain-containing protein [bacterium]